MRICTKRRFNIPISFGALALRRADHGLLHCREKKVLVIHPFEKSIQEQYKKRVMIFPNSQILPEFELKTLKAVQTLCGEQDERFETWFDALDYMYEQALNIDFDVAIIGCGAYGMPLASKLKNAGKQAIHLGGATQLLFGIKGYRWEEQYPTKIASFLMMRGSDRSLKRHHVMQEQ